MEIQLLKIVFGVFSAPRLYFRYISIPQMICFYSLYNMQYIKKGLKKQLIFPWAILMLFPPEVLTFKTNVAWKICPQNK